MFLGEAVSRLIQKESRRREKLTLSLIESLANELQFRFELGVLRIQLLVRILQKSLEILDSFVACKKLAIGQSEFAFESSVLFDKLQKVDERISTIPERRRSRAGENVPASERC